MVILNNDFSKNLETESFLCLLISWGSPVTDDIYKSDRLSSSMMVEIVKGLDDTEGFLGFYLNDGTLIKYNRSQISRAVVYRNRKEENES